MDKGLYVAEVDWGWTKDKGEELPRATKGVTAILGNGAQIKIDIDDRDCLNLWLKNPSGRMLSAESSGSRNVLRIHAGHTATEHLIEQYRTKLHDAEIMLEQVRNQVSNCEGIALSTLNAIEEIVG